MILVILIIDPVDFQLIFVKYANSMQWLKLKPRFADSDTFFSHWNHPDAPLDISLHFLRDASSYYFYRVASDEIEKKLKPDLESARSKLHVPLSTAAYRPFYKRKSILFQSKSHSSKLNLFLLAEKWPTDSVGPFYVILDKQNDWIIISY